MPVRLAWPRACMPPLGPPACHVRVHLPPAELTAETFFGQQVLHMQFTHAETRRAVLQALHWWDASPASPSTSSAAATSPTAAASTCAAIATAGGGGSGGPGVGGAGKMAGVVVSSALSSALLCVLPGAQEGQPLTLASSCPCCWRVADLQKGVVNHVAASSEAAAAEAKALRRASRYAGCRIWRRHA